MLNTYVGHSFPSETKGMCTHSSIFGASLVAQTVKNLLQCGRPGFDPCVRKIPGEFLPGVSPWTEEPGRLQSMESQTVGHDFSLSCTEEGNGNPLQCSCLENPRDGGAWWAAIYGVTQSRTRLKRLSSSSK